MPMPREQVVFEARFNGYLLSTDRTRLDPAAVFDFLAHESYWARGMPLKQLRRALDNSLPVGIYSGDGKLAAFGRIVTDYAAFASLCPIIAARGSPPGLPAKSATIRSSQQ
jgi:hypothetical protein